MKNNTIYLEVTREKNSLKIGIRKKPDFSLEPSIDPYEIKEVSMETTEVSPKLKHNYHATMRSSVSMKYFFKDLG